MEPRRQNQCIWSVLGVIIGPIFVIYGILSPNQKVLYSGLVIFIFSMIGFPICWKKRKEWFHL